MTMTLSQSSLAQTVLNSPDPDCSYILGMCMIEMVQGIPKEREADVKQTQ